MAILSPLQIVQTMTDTLSAWEKLLNRKKVLSNKAFFLTELTKQEVGLNSGSIRLDSENNIVPSETSAYVWHLWENGYSNNAIVVLLLETEAATEIPENNKTLERYTYKEKVLRIRGVVNREYTLSLGDEYDDRLLVGINYEGDDHEFVFIDKKDKLHIVQLDSINFHWNGNISVDWEGEEVIEFDYPSYIDSYYDMLDEFKKLSVKPRKNYGGFRKPFQMPEEKTYRRNNGMAVFGR